MKKISDEYISKYLEGDLSAEGKSWFERQLEKNEELKKRKEFLEDLRNSLKEDEVMDFRDKVKGVMDKKAIHRKKKYSMKKVAPLAASILALILLVIIIIPDTPEKEGDIFDNYYEPYPLIINTRAADDGKHRQSAARFYENENWTGAEEEFEYLIKKQPDKHIFKLYYAIVKLELDKGKEAEMVLLDLLKEEELLVKDQVYWYLSLLYLKMEKEKKALGILRMIDKEDMFYSEKAKEIINKIDN